jgi:type IV pilus assembly protein PilW
MNRQTGFTMVEIMVALTLSLLLILGISSIFSGNRETYRVQGGLAILQENARYATEALRRDISMAGYPSDNDITAIAGAMTKDSGNEKPDTIAVSYISDRSCAGATVAPTLETRQYHIETDAVTKVPGLYCNDTLIVEGVENMQFQYGIDTDLDGAANQFSAADKVTDWSQVMAVRFALLVNSLEPVSREKDEATYVLLDAPEIPAASDMLRRRVFFGTVVLRNKTQS